MTNESCFILFLTEFEKERKGRTKRLIHLAQIASETPLPVQIEKFWGSDGNKKKLQSFCDEKLQYLAIQKQINVVLSGIIDNDNVTPAKSVPDFALHIEEADMRIIPHGIFFTFQICRTLCHVSRDTDVTVYLLFLL